MLAIRRALLTRPRLLLDESSMGLAPQVVENVFSVIQDVAREGVA
jgi:branched-chain amino acid transport system ATP-binding protein